MDADADPTGVISERGMIQVPPFALPFSTLASAEARTAWDGLGHAFHFDSRLPESREAYDIIVRFFDRHLGQAMEDRIV